MPTYRNLTDNIQFNSGIKFAPNEEKEVNFYIFDNDIELISDYPIPVVITHAGSFSLDTDDLETIDLSSIGEECLLDIIIQIPDGGIEVYHNTVDNLPIEFKGVYQDIISTKYLKTIIIKAKNDGVEGSFFIKKGK
jgi:hypothetical protein